MKKQSITTLVLISAMGMLLAILIVSLMTYANRCDLPEELEALTTDRLHPDPLFGWKDSVTGKPHVEMRNYKH